MTPTARNQFRLPHWAGAGLFAAAAAVFLWQEHRLHVLGALPWLIIAACPLIHLFMHRGHHPGHESQGAKQRGEGDER